MKKESQFLLIVVAVLVCIGIVMVYSSSSCYAYERFHDSAFYLKRHILYFMIGLALSLFVLKFDYKKIRKSSKILLALSVFSLVVVFLPGIGHAAGGAKRWIKLGILSFQPSEFAGLFLIIYLADILERKQHLIRNFFYGFMPPLIISGVVVLLILLQPDLGNAVALLAVVLIMLFASGANMMHVVTLVLLFLPTLYFLIFRVPYRLRRIIGYLDPWSEAQTEGFQIVQSFLALGSGGIFGLGLGCSRQKLFYLPQAHTDFIFSIIGEELGLIGTVGTVFLFSAFVCLGIIISIKARDLFAKFLALGITVSIGFKAFINIAVSTGAIPTKGLPLPFISYGGTALIFNIVGVAILLSIANK
ncbi:MAG: putative lipid II flippase FtsW [Candidatus Omnitrophica bacterium]|nr:putative lipid II flippase FtsW [Candidatus Omnitrophota bacterium]